MYRVYVHNKPLFLSSSVTKEIEDYLQRADTLFLDELNPAGIKTMLQQLQKDSIYAGVYLHSDADELLNAFKAQLTVIQAAGGLVFTNGADKQVLLIFRRGKWDLPKGKLDSGEDLETCAIREVEEETGLKGASILQPLSLTYHTYHEGGVHILKESHWFLMKASSAVPLTPQTEEDIEECKWIALAKLKNYTAHMHASLVDVVQKGYQILCGPV